MKQALMVLAILVVPVSLTLLYGGVEPTAAQSHQAEVIAAKWRIEAELFCRDVAGLDVKEFASLFRE